MKQCVRAIPKLLTQRKRMTAKMDLNLQKNIKTRRKAKKLYPIRKKIIVWKSNPTHARHHQSFDTTAFKKIIFEIINNEITWLYNLFIFYVKKLYITW